MPSGRPKRNPNICFDCGFDPATIFTKPTGGNFPRDQGLCRECYERAIRNGKSYARRSQSKWLSAIEESNHITMFF